MSTKLALAYLELLAKYITYVELCGGTNFLNDKYRYMSNLSDEEWEKLCGLARERLT